MTDLEAGYRRCGELTKQYGTTYYWGARLLPPAQRRDVFTVYALCRIADDIVDEPDRVDAVVPPGGGRPGSGCPPSAPPSSGRWRRARTSR